MCARLPRLLCWTLSSARVPITIMCASRLMSLLRLFLGRKHLHVAPRNCILTRAVSPCETCPRPVRGRVSADVGVLREAARCWASPTLRALVASALVRARARATLVVGAIGARVRRSSWALSVFERIGPRVDAGPRSCSTSTRPRPRRARQLASPLVYATRPGQCFAAVPGRQAWGVDGGRLETRRYIVAGSRPAWGVHYGALL